MQSDINLGVVVRNGKLIAQVSEENCEWIKILIRELGGEWKEHKLEPHPLYPTIFTATLDYDAKKSTNANYEYIFESDRGYFLDDRARLIKSPSGYGKLPAFEGKTGLRDRC